MLPELQFEFNGADVADQRMPSDRVVEIVDVVGDGDERSTSRGKRNVVDHLALDRCKKALGDRIVVAVALTAHACECAHLRDGVGVV